MENYALIMIIGMIAGSVCFLAIEMIAIIILAIKRARSKK